MSEPTSIAAVPAEPGPVVASTSGLVVGLILHGLEALRLAQLAVCTEPASATQECMLQHLRSAREQARQALRWQCGIDRAMPPADTIPPITE